MINENESILEIIRDRHKSEALRMIDQEDYFAIDCALRYGQIFDNVKNTKWFLNILCDQLATE